MHLNSPDNVIFSIESHRNFSARLPAISIEREKKLQLMKKHHK